MDTIKEETREFLKANSEKKYKEFSKSLIPGEINMLGVRLPVLRKKAKELAKGHWKEELKTEDVYFEEIMLRGMMLGYVKESLEVMLPYIEAFIPKVQNWSVCDSVFSKMDVFRTDRERTWEFIQPYLYSEKEFEVRTAVIIMMQHLLKCDEKGKSIKRLKSIAYEDCLTDQPAGTEENGKYLPRILEALNREFPSYYASMAAAWTIAEAFCCFPAFVYGFLKENRMDEATYNRALQKIIESLIPQPKVKEMIREMKQRNHNSEKEKTVEK